VGLVQGTTEVFWRLSANRLLLMPKFFFDTTDGTNTFRDREGVTLDNPAAAQMHARDTAEQLARGGKYDDFYVVVRDESEAPIFRVPVVQRH
jgi:hypothetical protein